MQINIDVFLTVEGTKMRSGGPFTVNTREYRENPDFTAAVVAYQFIQERIREMGYRHTVIDKVLYQGDKDITKLTKQIEPMLPPDNLPF